MGVLVWLILLGALVGGCNRAPQSAPVNSTPTTQTAATNPDTEPAPTVLSIDGKDLFFPPAILRVSPADGHLHARLFTDDPPQAIETNYRGNSFDLMMTLNVPDAGQLSQAVWQFTGSEQPQQRESSRGIFLDGQRQRLHAQAVVVKFNPDGTDVDVLVDGWFMLYANSAKDVAPSPPQRVYVKGHVAAKLLSP